MTVPIIAVSRSKYGGRCQHCGRPIARGELVVKVDAGRRGKQTSGGNGRGEWWGRCCVPADPPVAVA